MFKIYITSVLSFLLVSLASGQLEDVKLISANDAYTKGNYDQAIQKYESVIATGKESAELYYNLGNAYFKMKNIPASMSTWIIRKSGSTSKTVLFA